MLPNADVPFQLDAHLHPDTATVHDQLSAVPVPVFNGRAHLLQGPSHVNHRQRGLARGPGQ